MNDVSTARDIMTIEWKDPNMKLHGKRHKSDRFYFRWHYGKQRRVYMYTEYVDKPTERQVGAREAFTALRREVARQLRDAVLREAWERRFAEDNEGYKFLHTYVYAKLKAPSNSPIKGESEAELSRESLSYGGTGTTETTGSVGKEQKFRNAEVQKFRSAEVQRFRGVEGQMFRKGCAAAETEATMSSMRRGNALVSTPCAGSGFGKSSAETRCMASLQATPTETRLKGVSTSGTEQRCRSTEVQKFRDWEVAVVVVWDGVVMPVFLPSQVPKWK